MASVWYKFRSSSTFESLDIGEQASISIRDLKAIIVFKKHLNLYQNDDDLVFSDSLSGQEYEDENIRIPSGSSVIIKRVPVKSSPSCRAFNTLEGCFAIRDAGCVNFIDPPVVDVGAYDPDDFGIDLSPISCSSFFDMGKMLLNDTRKKDDVVPRCSQEVLIRCLNLEATSPIRSTPKDSNANEGSTLVMSKPKIEEPIELERTSPAKHLEMEKIDWPSELECYLCRNFFKEAVTMPCCQHSFCAKCIRTGVLENKKCRMRTSTECQQKDLLPNVSLSFYDSNWPGGANVAPDSINERGNHEGEIRAVNQDTGPRICYMCGSPDHLIRDCPGAANSFSNHWIGIASRPGTVSSYPSPYWPEDPPHAVPIISPYAFSSCAPSIYGGYPVSGYTSVGGMTPLAANNAQQPRQLDLPEHLSTEELQRSYDEYLSRERISNRNQNSNAHHDGAEKGSYHSGDSFGRRLKGNYRRQDKSNVDTYSDCNKQRRTAHHLEYRRDRRIAQSDRPSSEKYVLDSRIRSGEDMQEQIYRIDWRNDEIRGQHGCDSVQKHYPSNNVSSKRQRTEHDEKKSDRLSHSHSRSSLEPSDPSDGSRKWEEEPSHGSLHRNKIAKLDGKEMHHDCGKMKYPAYYSDDYHHKRKRSH